MPPLTFEYEITQPEFIEMAWLRHRSSIRWSIGVGVGIVGLVLGGLFYKYADHWVGAFTIAMSIFLLLMQFVIPTAAFHRAYRRNRKMFGKRVVTITDHGIQSDHELGHSEATWNMYEKFRETPRLFLLFQSADLIGILPKRVFTNPGDIESFRNFLASWIPGK
jgi:hypothetical protein